MSKETANIRERRLRREDVRLWSSLDGVLGWIDGSHSSLGED